MSEQGLAKEHLAETDEGAFRRWLLDTSEEIEFRDPAFRRFKDVLLARQRGDATSLELAVMFRQIVQRWQLSKVALPPLAVGDCVDLVENAGWSRAGLRTTRSADCNYVHALSAWKPGWLENPAGIAVDEACCAGTESGWRERPGLSDADPIFEAATGYKTYKTPGQRSAVRAALEMNPSGVTLTSLPTGSGKTEVAMTLAHFARKNQLGTVLMIVPTIALAQDLESRFRRDWERIKGGDFSAEPFAWTSETPADKRDDLKIRMSTGQQPILVTSPESLTGALMESVRTAASNDRLCALVVDEAHLITQWGRGFRPQYRLLGKLWAELNSLGSEGYGVRALLLSATWTSDTLTDVVALFPSEDGPTVVAANAIRSEPRFWTAAHCEREERETRVLEALDQMPRPCILYVTQPKEAKKWFDLLCENGYKRIAKVTGDSSAAERRLALEGIRTSDAGSKYDVVVATSAFGLGVDADEIRTIIHACIPETVDRWYQEVGRAGRDGYASTSLLIPACGDDREAGSLGLSALTTDIAAMRWKSLWEKGSEAGRVHVGQDSYVHLGSCPPGKKDGSYTRRWNEQILEGLEAQGILTREVVSFEEALKLGLPSRVDPNSHLFDDWQRVTLLGPPPQEDFFAKEWVAWKTEMESASRTSLEHMQKFIKSRDACSAIEAAYQQTNTTKDLLGVDACDGFSVVRPCGRCQACADNSETDFQDPAPIPRKRWSAHPQESTFSRFVTDYPAYSADEELRGVGLVQCNSEELTDLLPLLADSGVKKVVGVRRADVVNAQIPYFDPELDLVWLDPIATVVAIGADGSLDAVLSGLKSRFATAGGAKGFVLLQVESVPRDLLHNLPFTAQDLRKKLRNQE